MRYFKTIDVWAQAALLLVSALLYLIDPFLGFLLYFPGMALWQLFSMLIHALFFRSEGFMRKRRVFMVCIAMALVLLPTLAEWIQISTETTRAYMKTCFVYSIAYAAVSILEYRSMLAVREQVEFIDIQKH